MCCSAVRIFCLSQQLLVGQKSEGPGGAAAHRDHADWAGSEMLTMHFENIFSAPLSTPASLCSRSNRNIRR